MYISGETCWAITLGPQWRIQDFPEVGGDNSPGEAPTYDFAKFSQKLYEIESIWTTRGARTKFYYVDPPLGLYKRSRWNFRLEPCPTEYLDPPLCFLWTLYRRSLSVEFDFGLLGILLQPLVTNTKTSGDFLTATSLSFPPEICINK